MNKNKNGKQKKPAFLRCKIKFFSLFALQNRAKVFDKGSLLF